MTYGLRFIEDDFIISPALHLHVKELYVNENKLKLLTSDNILAYFGVKPEKPLAFTEVPTSTSKLFCSNRSLTLFPCYWRLPSSKKIALKVIDSDQYLLRSMPLFNGKPVKNESGVVCGILVYQDYWNIYVISDLSLNLQSKHWGLVKPLTLRYIKGINKGEQIVFLDRMLIYRNNISNNFVIETNHSDSLDSTSDFVGLLKWRDGRIETFEGVVTIYYEFVTALTTSLPEITGVSSSTLELISRIPREDWLVTSLLSNAQLSKTSKSG